MTEKQYSKVVLTKKNKKITFRFIQKDDLDKLLNFINKLADEDTFVLVNKRFTKKEEEKYLRERLKGIRTKKSFNIAAFYGGKIMAHGDVVRKERRQEHVGELAISVSRGFRDEGLGSFLIKELITMAKDFLKLKILYLRVFGNNQRARHIYRKMGFKECGQIPKALFYKDKYEDEIMMFKEL